MRTACLIVCNTPYQIILACALRRSLLCEFDVDVAITDMFNGAEKIAKRAKTENLFRNVYYVRDRAVQDGKSLKSRIIKVLNLVNPYMCIGKVWGKSVVPNYDKLFYCVPSLLLFNIFEVLREKNASLETYVYEEGYSTYTGTVGSLKTEKLIRKRALILHTPFMLKHLSGLLVFEPELVVHDYGCPIIKLERNEFYDENFKNMVERLFGIGSFAKEEFSAKYILIEEAFYMKNPEIDDIQLYKKIADILGKKNVMVKYHPRSVKKRFANMGIAENRNNEIPWEALLLTQGFEDKILFAISSGSVINAGLCLGKTVRSYLLFNCINHLPQQLDENFRFFIEKYEKLYKETVKIPKNESDLELELKKIEC